MTKVNGKYDSSQRNWMNEMESDFHYPMESASNLSTSNINQKKGNSTTSNSELLDKQRWQTLSLRVKFLEHLQSYHYTGKTDFALLDIVAKMASEGKVFTPNQAEQIIQKIEDSTANISHLVCQIELLLDYVNTAQFQLDIVNSKREQLKKNTCILQEVVKIEVLPITSLVDLEQCQKLQVNLSDLSYAMHYLLERAHTDIIAAQSIGKEKLYRCLNHLHIISHASQAISECAKQMILVRVPFYQFSLGG